MAASPPTPTSPVPPELPVTADRPSIQPIGDDARSAFVSGSR